MYIIDLKGEKIEVTDLQKAIEQAESFKESGHVDSSFEAFDKKQRAYWQDIYNKLLTLKTSNNDQQATKCSR